MSYREERRQANREARRSYDSGTDSDSSDGSSSDDDSSSSSSSGSSSDSSQSYREERRQANREAASGGSSGSSGSSDDQPEDQTPEGMPGNPDRTDSDSGSTDTSDSSSSDPPEDNTPPGMPGNPDRTDSDSGSSDPSDTDRTPGGLPGSTDRRERIQDGQPPEDQTPEGMPGSTDRRDTIESGRPPEDQTPAGMPGSTGRRRTVEEGQTGVQDSRPTRDRSTEPERVIESRVPDEGDILAGTSSGVRDLGRTILGEQAPDPDVTDRLTEGGGDIPFTLDAGERRAAQEGAENYREYFGVGEEAEQVTRDLTGSETAGTFAGGLGKGVGDLASIVREGPLVADTVIKASANLPETIEEEGAADTGEAIANTVLSGARGGVESFEDAPVETTGRIASGFAAGAAVTRGASAARTGIRSGRVRSRADNEVDLEDITSEKGVEGENPTFETDPDAPTSEAVDEVRRRAEDNPDAATPGDSDSAVYHTTQSDISGSRGARNRVRDAVDDVTPGQSTDIDVSEGASELPGLFTSPDASPLGLDMGGRSSIATSLGRPRLRGGKSDQVVSLPGDDIRGMPDSAQGAGYELRAPDGTVQERGLGRGQAKSRAEGTDLEVRPDSSTQGYEFLTEEAEAGSVYVRPSGSRTPELEGIAPPGSQYVEEGITAVNMPGRSVSLPGGREVGIPGTGRTIPMRRFERVDGDSDGATSPDVDSDVDLDDVDADADPVSAYELPSSQSRDVTPGQQAAAGGYLGGAGTAVSGGDGTTTTSGSSSDSTTPDLPSPIDMSSTGPTEPTRSGSSSDSGTSTGGGSGGSSTGRPTGGSSNTGGSTTGGSTTGGGSGSPGSPGTPTGSGSSIPGVPTTSPPDTPNRPFPTPEEIEDEPELEDIPVQETGEEFDTGLSDVEDLESDGFTEDAEFEP